MKRTLSILATASVMACTISCSWNFDNASIGNSCTMLVYGSGGAGGNMDYNLMEYFIDAVNEGTNTRVKYAMAYNFKPGRTDSELEYISGTSFITISGKAQTKVEMPDISEKLKQCKTATDTTTLVNETCNEIFRTLHKAGLISVDKLDGTNKVNLSDPANIAKFIRAVESSCESERYILSVTGHGDGWSAESDAPVTKGIAWDDNFPKDKYTYHNITARGLAEGIQQSGFRDKVKCIYLDACMMNTLENLCEYASCGASYAIASIELTDGYNYGTLMNRLKNVENTDDGFEDALCSALNTIYCEDKDKVCGMMLIELQKITSLLPDTRTFVNQFKQEYPENRKFYNDLIKSLQRPEGNYPIKDFSEFMSAIAYDEGNTASDTLKFRAKVIYETLLCQVNPYYGGGSNISKFALTGVDFMGKSTYAAYCDNGLKPVFESNAFHRETGWNTLYEILDDEIE